MKAEIKPKKKPKESRNIMEEMLTLLLLACQIECTLRASRRPCDV